ncbi:MAG TPA: hypothetical protein ENG96_07030 [Gammaproteobacteria bacterium]|nr:hypothetical protein [Gammaproteobacteria bacterium]
MEKQHTNSVANRNVENYVLRLYRQSGASDHQELVGILEEPASGERWPFKSLRELNHLLKARQDIE